MEKWFLQMIRELKSLQLEIRQKIRIQVISIWMNYWQENMPAVKFLLIWF